MPRNATNTISPMYRQAMLKLKTRYINWNEKEQGGGRCDTTETEKQIQPVAWGGGLRSFSESLFV